MPRANAARAAKNALHATKSMTVTITIETSEANFQRLAALMLLQDPTKVIPDIVDLGPLPFDEAISAVANPQLELDYPAIRRDIVKWFEPYEKKHSREKLGGLIQSFGGNKVSTVPDSQVLELLAAIEAACE